jgi:hypothetical protein
MEVSIRGGGKSSKGYVSEMVVSVVNCIFGNEVTVGFSLVET